MIENLYTIIEPLFKNEQSELYHIEFIKEDGENYLRVYIYNEVGISLDDCETISKKISELLDEKDPIESSYYLEVSSPGINRILYTDKHLNQSIGSEISISLTEKVNNESHYKGKLISFNDLNMIINVNSENIPIVRQKIKSMNIEGEM